MIQLAYPWLLAVLVLPLAVLLLPPFRQPRAAVAVPFLDRLARLTGQSPTPGAAVARPGLFQRIVLVLAWTCMVLALARPQWVEPPVVRELPTRDLLLAVDLSGSMETEDFTDQSGRTIDRLAAAKQVVGDFLLRRDGDRVGLIVFGTAPFVQVPFTQDLAVSRRLLDETSVRMAGPQTMLGDAIGLAISTFENSQVQERVLILMTDGNDTGSKVPPVEAARIARDRGITIHTIAVGDPAAVGEDRLDEETLRSIASTTGGAYFHANDRAELEGVYQRLDELETRKVETISYRPRHDLFFWPLGIALALTMLGQLALVLREVVRRRRPAPVATTAAFWPVLGIGEFHLLRPWWLLALLPALLLAWEIGRRQDSARPWRGVIAPHLLQHLMVTQEQQGIRPWQVLLAAWCIAILALSGPTWRREPAPFAQDQAALMIAMKVTPSMLAQDIQPTRLERAAQKIKDLLALRPDAASGLVAYAGSAHLVMPLTRDADIVAGFAAELVPDVMPREGDAPAEAVALADQELKSSGQPGSILLVTDAVTPDQAEALRRIRENGGAPVHVLAVAAGTEVSVVGGPPAPALDRAALQAAADAGGGGLTVVTPDPADVTALAGEVATSLADVAGGVDGGERWQDAGYWLVPLVVLLNLMWFRRGWVVRWS
ncbi:VWA domain-containing protein [Geminicoccus roseus]|uniref:VWA domain-containing protein n=1 Tax=Geminicoccus roseus TaxID=404900 RepID=UPI000411FF41|nr:VWA domain-containing protein [Geminicoccus roseus]